MFPPKLIVSEYLYVFGEMNAKISTHGKHGNKTYLTKTK